MNMVIGINISAVCIIFTFSDWCYCKRDSEQSIWMTEDKKNPQSESCSSAGLRWVWFQGVGGSCQSALTVLTSLVSRHVFRVSFNLHKIQLVIETASMLSQLYPVSRFGPSGSITFRWRGEKMTFNPWFSKTDFDNRFHMYVKWNSFTINHPTTEPRWLFGYLVTNRANHKGKEQAIEPIHSLCIGKSGVFPKHQTILLQQPLPIQLVFWDIYA